MLTPNHGGLHIGLRWIRTCDQLHAGLALYHKFHNAMGADTM